jgi:glycosyltransferase involved in cell wall biosynthesis
MEMATKNNPMVALAIPVYNGDKFLRECLESVRLQTYQNWNCVIVDNQSTDGTNAIAHEFAEQDNRFKLVVNNEFVDQTTNWNIAFKESDKDAEYFKMICADDWIFPQYLEKFIAVMESNAGIGICSSYRIDGVRVRCDGLDYYQGSLFNGKQILVKELKGVLDITGSISTVMYRRSLLEQLPYFPEIFLQDTYHIDTILAFDMLYYSDLGFVFDVLSYTRRHDLTYTSQISDRYKTSYYMKERSLRLFHEIDPELKRQYKKVRLDYAYFIILALIRNDRSCLRWHKKFLQKKFKFKEYVVALITRNMFSRQVRKVIHIGKS